SRNGALAAANNDGLIGGEVLRRFAVILDYRRQRMIITPNEDFSQSYETGMSGALLTAEGADLNTIKVYKTIEDSPAALAGLLPGDIVVSIDGKPTSAMNLEQVNEMLKQEGRTVLLSIKRGNRILTVQIRFRRLI